MAGGVGGVRPRRRLRAGRRQDDGRWLSWACGISGEAARERVRVASALPGLPLVSARFGEGRLSFSKVRAITRVATQENEETLVAYAEHATAAQLEDVVRGFRRVVGDPQDAGADGSEDLAHRERRGLRWWTDEDGYVRFAARLPADDGMIVVKALEWVADALAQPPAADGADTEPSEDPVFGAGDRPVASKPWETPEPAEVRRADALRVLAETTLVHGPAARTGDELYQVVLLMRDDHLLAAGDELADNEARGDHPRRSRTRPVPSAPPAVTAPSCRSRCPVSRGRYLSRPPPSPTGLQCPRRRPGASLVTRASSRWSKTPSAGPSGRPPNPGRAPTVAPRADAP